MSPPWTKPLDIARLADGGAGIDFDVPLAELPRLRSQLASVEGLVRGRVHFAREAGFVVAALTVTGTASLVCQRCLGAMTEAVDGSVRVALIENRKSRHRNRLRSCRSCSNVEVEVAKGGFDCMKTVGV